MSKLTKLVRYTAAKAGRAGSPGGPGFLPTPAHTRYIAYTIYPTRPLIPVYLINPTEEELVGYRELAWETFWDSDQASLGEVPTWLVEETASGGSTIETDPAKILLKIRMAQFEAMWLQATATGHYFLGFATPPDAPKNISLFPIEVPADPGYPPVPPVPAIPPTPATVSAPDWDGGGTSLADVTGDVGLTFKVPHGAVGVVCGISTQRESGGGYEDIEFALYVSRGSARPIESGVFVTPSQAPFNDGDELSITLRNGDVTYGVNGVAFHTGAARHLGRVYARAELFAPNDSVADATLVRLQRQGARSAGSLHPLESGASDKEYTSSEGELPPLESSSVCVDRCGSTGVLHPLIGLSANRPYAAGHGALHPLSGHSRPARIVPNFCISEGALAPLSGASSGKTGGVLSSSGSIAALTGKSSDRPYAEAATSLHPLSGISFDALPTYGYFIYRMAGKFTLAAAGQVTAKNAADFTAPKGTLLAFSGAVFAGRAPRAGLSSSGIVPIMGRAAMRIPDTTLDASGTVAAIGGAIAVGPRTTLSAFGGGAASLHSPRAAFVGQARTDTVGQATLVLRGAATASGFAGAVLTQRLFGRPTLEASAATAVQGAALLVAPAAVVAVSGTGGGFGVAGLMMPMPRVSASPSRAVLVLPFPTLAASGSAALAPWTGAWVFNLIDPPTKAGRQQDEKYAASQYTNFPFFRIVRFGGHHYGVSATGLYRLDGETDAGEPIAWAVETAISDFGSPQLKAMPSAYVGAHLGPQARVKAVVGEHGSHEYAYPNVRGAPVQNHRVAFGRGMRSRYYGVRLEDPAGGQLHLDSIDLEVVALTRKI